MHLLGNQSNNPAQCFTHTHTHCFPYSWAAYLLVLFNNKAREGWAAQTSKPIVSVTEPLPAVMGQMQEKKHSGNKNSLEPEEWNDLWRQYTLNELEKFKVSHSTAGRQRVGHRWSLLKLADAELRFNKEGTATNIISPLTLKRPYKFIRSSKTSGANNITAVKW